MMLLKEVPTYSKFLYWSPHRRRTYPVSGSLDSTGRCLIPSTRCRIPVLSFFEELKAADAAYAAVFSAKATSELYPCFAKYSTHFFGLSKLIRNKLRIGSLKILIIFSKSPTPISIV